MYRTRERDGGGREGGKEEGKEGMIDRWRERGI